MKNKQYLTPELLDWLSDNLNPFCPCSQCGREVDRSRAPKMIVGLPAEHDGGPYIFHSICMACMRTIIGRIA
jgi:hypothetical protein